MVSLRSTTAGGTDTASVVAENSFRDFATLFPQKLYWFLKTKYQPHEWQAAFHTAHGPDGLITRYRHLAAGRRGGKTMSAAREVLYYCENPTQFHLEYHGKESSRPLWVWVVTKDHEYGLPSRMAFQEALNEAGLVKEKDYIWNKSYKTVEFLNSGTFLQFRSAEDPQSLRGAGLDIMWIDEAAHIPTIEAWSVARPAASDKVGMFITTTTPAGKNWLWEEFWHKRKDHANQFRVEYTSIDSIYFPTAEWEEARESMHPVMFKQEYLASFDAMAGIELHGDWLRFYTIGAPGPEEIRLPLKEGNFVGRKFMGVDPAVSLSDQADHFAMVLLGLSDDGTQAFILDTLKERLAFPDQLLRIKEWFLKYRPEYIGIESNAYQRALEQQAARIEGLPNTVPVFSRGKKFERILSMSPAFKIGKVRIHAGQRDFIDEWVSYNSKVKNPKDDLLDAAEIALSAAGVLLPSYIPLELEPRHMTEAEEAAAQIQAHLHDGDLYDRDLGSEA